MNHPIANAENATISPVKLAHIVFRTANYEVMLQWWTRLLGATVRHASPFVSFLAYDDEHHRIAIINNPILANSDRNAVGVDHVAFTYADMGALMSNYERLRSLGVMPYWCINHGPTTSLYYRDPDDNQVELQIDNFPTMAQASAWMESEAFRKNPIGVEFDPEVLLAKFRAGVPVPVLVEQGSTRAPQ